MARGEQVARSSLIVLWLILAGSLLLRSHEDVFTGLDNMAYRLMPKVLLGGRGFHSQDVVLRDVPERCARYFYIVLDRWDEQRGIWCFSCRGGIVPTPRHFYADVATCRGGVEPWLKSDQFVPLVGAIWAALLLAAGFGAGGGWGLLAAGRYG